MTLTEAGIDALAPLRLFFRTCLHSRELHQHGPSCALPTRRPHPPHHRQLAGMAQTKGSNEGTGAKAHDELLVSSLRVSRAWGWSVPEHELLAESLAGVGIVCRLQGAARHRKRVKRRRPHSESRSSSSS